MQDKTEWIRAGFGPRAAAFLLDQFLVAAALLVIKLPAWLVRLYGGQPIGDVLFSFSLLDVLCYVLLSAYFVLLTYITGSTLGKKVMGIKVVREAGEDLRFVDVLYRETIGRYLSGVLFLGYFMVLVDTRKRAFHDYLCETCVIYDHEKKSKPHAAPRAAGTGLAESVPVAGYTVPGAGCAAPAEEMDAAGPASPEESAPEEETLLNAPFLPETEKTL